MARMPGARWLDEHSPRRPMARYDIVCIHTIVGWAPAHAAHFSVHLDGQIDQSRDTAYQSAANLDGNPRVIAIENEDGGRWWEPLTDAQVESNAQILAWAHAEHGIPLHLCPNSRPGATGLAYHRQGIDGNFGGYRFPGRVPGGETWTEHFGKLCPGDAKIAQRPEILARAKALTNPTRPRPEEDTMPEPKELWDSKDVDFIASPYGEKDNPNLRPRYALAHALQHSLAARQIATRTEAKVDALVDALEQLAPGVKAAAAKGAREALADGIDITVSTTDE